MTGAHRNLPIQLHHKQVEDSSDDSGGLTPAQKKQYRAVIEALVREVVPDEIEHVDSMMEQFVGREEELINTLRNMVTDDGKFV